MHNQAVNQLSTRAREALLEALDPGEQVLWAGRQVPNHSWTVIGTTFPRSLIGRAISLVVFEVLALWIVAIGLVLAAAFLDLLLGFPWSIPEAIGMLFVLPFSILVIGVGLQAATKPLVVMRAAKQTSFALTGLGVYIVDGGGSEVRIRRYDLARVHPPDVYRLSKTGIGDVIFDSTTAELIGGDSDTSAAFFDRGFFAVRDARRVAQMVDRTRFARQTELYGSANPLRSIGSTP